MRGARPIVSHDAPAQLPPGPGLMPVLDRLSNGVMVLNASGVVLAANTAAGRILNLTPARLIGRPIAHSLPPPVRASFPDGEAPRVAVLEACFDGEGAAERRYLVKIAPLDDGTWVVEWIEISETRALRRAAPDETVVHDELQQAREELRYAFELTETEIENSREQLHVHEALIEQLLRANQELMQANRRLQGGGGTPGD